MLSLHARLLRATVGLTLLVLLLAGAALYLGGRSFLLRDLDRELADRAATLATAVEHERGEGEELEVLFEHALNDPGGRRLGLEALAIWLGSDLLVRLPVEGGAEEALASARGLAHGETSAVPLPAGRAGRAVAWVWPDEGEVVGGNGGADGEASPLRMVLVIDATPVHALLRRFALALVAGGLIAAGGLVAAVAWGVGRGLKPVHALADSLAARGAGELTDELDASAVPQELGPVVVRFNALLGRVAEAMQQQRLFSANAAHELRTPLAGLRTTLEVLASRLERSGAGDNGAPDQEGAMRDAVGRALRATLQMENLVEALLMLTRLDEKRGEAVDRRFNGASGDTRHDLGKLADAVGRALDVEGDASLRYAFRAEDVGGCTVVGEEALLRLPLRNLLRNAADYVDDGGDVVSRVFVDGDDVVFQVENTGATLREEEMTEVFKPMWRQDAARSGGTHAGLGLPLARRAAERLGGTLEAEMTGDRRFVATLRLPACETD